MHFKIAVILCALYFVTMTQSVGVNKNQVKVIVELVKDSEKDEDKITPREFQAKFVELGVKNVEVWIYEEGTTDGQKTQSVMVHLAKNNKTKDNWVTTNLSSQEVIVYLSLFTYHDKQDPSIDGLVNPKELRNIIEGLRLNRGEKESLAGIFQGDETVNFAEFLFGILTVKEKGIDELNKGLDMNQLEFLSSIKLQIKNDDYIQPEKITQVVEGLPIIVGKHDEWKFERFQKWPLELQELVVVSAEYNTTADEKKGVVLSTSEVRGHIWSFAVIDENRDGFLSGKELDDVVKCKGFEGHTVSSLMDGDSSGDNKLDILEIIALIFKTLEEYAASHPK